MRRAAQSEPGMVQARTQAAYPWRSEGAGEGRRESPGCVSCDGFRRDTD